MAFPVIFLLRGQARSPRPRCARSRVEVGRFQGFWVVQELTMIQRIIRQL